MPSGKAGRILIIDDEAPVASLFEDFLRRRGYGRVRVALSGEAGLRAVDEERPDVVLLDIAMPDSNGLDVLRAIERVDHTIPVIMVTATTDDGVCRDALRLGAYSWLSKPVTLATLERFVVLALGRRRSAVG